VAERVVIERGAASSACLRNRTGRTITSLRASAAIARISCAHRYRRMAHGASMSWQSDCLRAGAGGRKHRAPERRTRHLQLVPGTPSRDSRGRVGRAAFGHARCGGGVLFFGWFAAFPGRGGTKVPQFDPAPRNMLWRCKCSHVQAEVRILRPSSPEDDGWRRTYHRLCDAGARRANVRVTRAGRGAMGRRTRDMLVWMQGQFCWCDSRP